MPVVSSCCEKASRMPTIDLPSGTIYYVRAKARQPTYPPLVLVHGAGGSHLDWPPQLRRSEHAHTIALDLPGHGRAEGDGYETTRDYADAVVAVLNALAIPSAIFIGHSMGGAIAQQIAINTPDRVAGLILIATGSKLPVDPSLPERIINTTQQTISWIIDNAWNENAPADLKRLGRERMQSMSPAVLQADYRACKTFDVRDQIDQITVPALVIGSDADRMVPLKFSQTLSERIPRATLVTVADTGHMIPLEQPQIVTQAITQWLSEQTW